MARILVVEDETQIGMGLQFNLEAEGHEVEWVDNGADALARLADEPDAFNLVILDVMMEGINGFEVARRVRASENYVPILMLTAKDMVADRVEGLRAGADDYLTKPFALEELLARAAVLLRRQKWANQGDEHLADDGFAALIFGPNQVDFRTHAATGPRGDVNLTAMEISVLRYLAGRAGEVVSRKDLLENVWGISGRVATRTVDNFMVRLRRHFEQDPRNPKHFLSVRGVGYRFIPEG